ncbi:MAG: bamD [Acidobacteria bacterium]|nr:bamD [Acidobacteriota bacterium]
MKFNGGILKLTRILIVLAMALALAGCRHGNSTSRAIRPPVDPEIVKLTKEQIFERGEQQFAHKRFQKARGYYTYIYENFPNDALARKGLLRIADTFYAQGDDVSLVEAQYKYRDFLNRYPGSENADYAMLQIANVSYKQMQKPDRDQQRTHEALEKFTDMIKTHPRSPLRPEAEKKMQEVLDRLAQHEQIVAHYYMKRKTWDAAVARLNTIVEQYPNFTGRDAVFFELATSLDALGRKGEARLYYERVVSEFPKSDYAGKAKHRLETRKAA